jgi:hypothetical protein
MTGKLFALLILSGFAGLLAFATNYKASCCVTRPQNIRRGKLVEVFFNPAEAVLERRVSSGGFVYLVAFALHAAAAKAGALFRALAPRRLLLRLR